MCHRVRVDRKQKVAITWSATLVTLLITGAFVVACGQSDAPERARTAGPDACAGPGPEQVTVYVDGDPDMCAAAEQLHDDDQIAASYKETRDEAWERFKTLSADRPELIDLARPEAQPSSLWAVTG
jgi:hypothetical protein